MTQSTFLVKIVILIILSVLMNWRLQWRQSSIMRSIGPRRPRGLRTQTKKLGWVTGRGQSKLRSVMELTRLILPSNQLSIRLSTLKRWTGLIIIRVITKSRM